MKAEDFNLGAPTTLWGSVVDFLTRGPARRAAWREGYNYGYEYGYAVGERTALTELMKIVRKTP